MARKPPPPAPKGTMPPNAGKGRPKGSMNKGTAEIRAFAQQYAPDALLGLAILSGVTPPLKRLPGIKLATTEAVQKSAMETLLERAYGRPSQPMEHSIDENMEALLDRIARVV